MVDRLERLVNLTATLLDTRRPLTLDELAERVEPRYPDDKTARRRQFERDKETLRELGVPIAVESIDGFGAEQALPRSTRRTTTSPSCRSPTPSSRHCTSRSPRCDSWAARGARDWPSSGAWRGRGSRKRWPASPSRPGVAALFDAVSRRAPITFVYRGERRRLEPYGVVLRWGHWYVVGHDVDRDAPRAFRVDRIDGDPEVGAAGAFEPPPGIDPARLRPRRPAHVRRRPPDRRTRVLVDASRAGWVVEQLGEEAVVDRRADGGVEVELPVVNRAAFRSWVLDLLDHAEVLGPDELRADVVGWLGAIVETGTP